MDGASPDGGDGVVIPSAHSLKVRIKLREEQIENVIATTASQRKAKGLVVKELAGIFACETATRTMVEFVSGGFHQSQDVGRDQVGEQALRESAFEIADAFFHSPIVRRIVWRTVERKDSVMSQDQIDLMAVKG